MKYSIEEIGNLSIEVVTEIIFPKRDDKGRIAFLHDKKAANKKTVSVVSDDPIDQYIPVLRSQGWPDHKIKERLDQMRAERHELLKQAGLA